MPRGNRLFVLALGLILCGAKPPQEQAKGQPSAQPTQQATAEPYAPYPVYNPDPCYQAKNHDTADLCAQWRASIAAEKAAHEARRATNWAIVATLLSAAGLGFIVWSLLQTNGALNEARRGNRFNLLFEKRYWREARKAAHDQEKALAIAERNAQAAEQLAQVSQVNARLQLRPYITAEDFSTKGFEVGSKYGVDFRVRNRGATPALNVVVVAYMDTKAKPVGPVAFIRQPNDTEGASRGVVAAQGDIFVATGGAIETTEKLMADFRAGKLGFFCWGVVTYEDIFGHQHTTSFRVEVEQDMRMSLCNEGNDAT